MRRFLTLLTIALAVATFAVACGDDDTEPVATDDPPASGDGATDDGADDPVGGGPYPIADLTVAYEHADAGVSLSYRITCLGDTATVDGDEVDVVDADACLALADDAVQTRLIDGLPADRACTEIYGGPDLATITGTIDDQPVDTVVDRTNGCGIDDWDSLLRDVLPTPLGVTD